jgi:putative DNA primase/helicase
MQRYYKDGQTPTAEFGLHPNGRRGPSSSWLIRDENGQVQAIHERFDKPGGGKAVVWRLPGENGYGLKGRGVSSLPLYRSEHIGGWPEDVPVAITEGEKAADALARVYPAVLGTVTGAANAPETAALEVLRDRRVVLWPDADKPGRAHMSEVGKRLSGIASEIRVYDPEGMPEGGDAADHPVVSKGSIELLLDEWAHAPVWTTEPNAEEPNRSRPLPSRRSRHVTSWTRSFSRCSGRWRG